MHSYLQLTRYSTKYPKDLEIGRYPGRKTKLLPQNYHAIRSVEVAFGQVGHNIQNGQLVGDRPAASRSAAVVVDRLLPPALPGNKRQLLHRVFDCASYVRAQMQVAYARCLCCLLEMQWSGFGITHGRISQNSIPSLNTQCMDGKVFPADALTRSTGSCSSACNSMFTDECIREVLYNNLVKLSVLYWVCSVQLDGVSLVVQVKPTAGRKPSQDASARMSSSFILEGKPDYLPLSSDSQNIPSRRWFLL